MGRNGGSIGTISVPFPPGENKQAFAIHIQCVGINIICAIIIGTMRHRATLRKCNVRTTCSRTRSYSGEVDEQMMSVTSTLAEIDRIIYIYIYSFSSTQYYNRILIAFRWRDSRRSSWSRIFDFSTIIVIKTE